MIASQAFLTCIFHSFIYARVVMFFVHDILLEMFASIRLYFSYILVLCYAQAVMLRCLYLYTF